MSDPMALRWPFVGRVKSIEIAVIGRNGELGKTKWQPREADLEALCLLVDYGFLFEEDFASDAVLSAAVQKLLPDMIKSYAARKRSIQ